jgi:hypothetical protein
MSNHRPCGLPERQRGVVLIVALVLLVAITLLSLAGISTTTLELMMATNQQARVDAFQQAEAGVDATSTKLDNFPVIGAIGVERCTPDFDDSNKYYEDGDVDCSTYDISLPSGYDLSYSRIRVERIPPLLQPAPRFIETSAEKLKVATFKVDSRYDARGIQGGRAEHNQGLIVTVLTPSEEEIVTDRDFDLD